MREDGRGGRVSPPGAKPRWRVLQWAAGLALGGLVAAMLGQGVEGAQGQPQDAQPERAFAYGSVGVDRSEELPYWLWVVLPRVFPEHLPGPGGYLSLGLVWEEGAEHPLGFAKTEGRLNPRVGPNCALCHLATYRRSQDDRRQLVPGGPSSTVDMQAYLRFLFKCANDPRFTPEIILPELEYITQLGPAERLLYRNVLIPQTRRALLKLQERSGWQERQPAWGPGRMDAFNPLKSGLLGLPVDDTLGGADMMPAWNLEPEGRRELYWDGSTDSVHEVLISSALRTGARPTSLAQEDLARLGDWLGGLRPPPFPFSIDAGLAATGKTVFAAHCAQCHEPEPGQGGTRIIPVTRKLEEEGPERIATDPHRMEAWSKASADAYNRYGSDHGWKFSHFKETEGYVAVRLDGLWLRSPYLHNGSVPTLWHLLHPEERPATFYRGYDVLDPERVGFKWDVAEERSRQQERRFFLYDTKLPGNSNQGHLYGARLSADEKRALLEYLKTL